MIMCHQPKIGAFNCKLALHVFSVGVHEAWVADIQETWAYFQQQLQKCKKQQKQRTLLKQTYGHLQQCENMRCLFYFPAHCLHPASVFFPAGHGTVYVQRVIRFGLSLDSTWRQTAHQDERQKRRGSFNFWFERLHSTETRKVSFTALSESLENDGRGKWDISEGTILYKASADSYSQFPVRLFCFLFTVTVSLTRSSAQHDSCCARVKVTLEMF